MSNHPRHRRSGRSRPKGPKGPKREKIAELHPVDAPPDIESFHEWDLGEDIQQAIADMGITVPTPIQKLAIGPVLEGKDVIAKAETGTGKTLGFGAPMMARIDPERATVLGLVLCPTRELAQQVADVLEALALPRGVQVALVVGGDPMQDQIKKLQAGAQVVVGTPGRVLDLYQQRFLSFPWTEYAVLDEADKMFEIGFLDDIRKILSFLPDERQTLLFSATFPTEVLKLARSSTKDPVEVATARGPSTVSSIDQTYMSVEPEDKALVLTRLIEQSEDDDVFLVFCERRTDVDRLLRRLERQRFSVKALHGGYDQPSRFRVMSAFRTGEVKALVATDVAARGLDVDHVTHVINLAVPRELEDYTHRIGRTGRAGRSGKAVTLVSGEDRRRWRALTSKAKWEIPEADVPGRYRAPARRERGRDEEDRGRRGEERPRRGRSSERGRTRDRSRNERAPRTGHRDDAREQDEPRRERSRRRSRDDRNPERSERSDEPRQERTRHRSRDDERSERGGESRRGRSRARSRDEREPERSGERDEPRRDRSRRSRDEREPERSRERDESRRDRPRRRSRDEREESRRDPESGRSRRGGGGPRRDDSRRERADEPRTPRRPTPDRASEKGTFGAGIDLD